MDYLRLHLPGGHGIFREQLADLNGVVRLYDPATSIIYLKANELPEIDLLQKIDPEVTSPTLSVHENGKKSILCIVLPAIKQYRKGMNPFIRHWSI